ncbi:MAG TPA: hypothetical protein VHJ20_20235 [Polyangia bacterium]|nr:hypothetical protein [Polyangia bacterium]
MRTRGAWRFGLTGGAIFAAAVVFLAAPVRAAGEDAPPTAKTASAPAKAGGTKKKSKKAKKAKSDDAPEAQASKPRRKIGVSPTYIVGDSDAHKINENAPPIVPFGENAKTVKQAFAENRRDQLKDAEQAARAEKSPDRWRTVLFHLHGMPEHGDSETCFWRVLSFYRLGEIERARKVREGCDLPAKDSSLLNQEDARATGTPSIEDLQRAALAEQNGEAAKDAGVAPEPPTAPYSGPAPTRYEP